MSNDKKFVMMCLEMAERAHERGDMPFGCVIVKDDGVLIKAENCVIKNNDVTQHAEIVAMRKAQKILGTSDFSRYEIYSSFEPCPMCSFMIRELRFKRVVFSLLSPVEGGYSKYKILQDKELYSRFPHHFGPVPEIVHGIFSDRAEEVWKRREELKKLSCVKKNV